MTKKKETDFKLLRTTTEQLQVQLTDDERAKRAIALAGEQGLLSAAERAKDEATKTHGGIIKRHEGRVDELAQVVNQGWEYRDVEVETFEDWEGKRIVNMRKDTAEVIFERPMNDVERQRSIPFPSKPEALPEAAPDAEYPV